MIVIIDYGMGNVGSLENMIKKVGESTQASADPATIEKATKLVLPGVGSFDNAMTRLKELDLIGIVNEKVIQEKVPILCICLGAQLVTNKSEEGNLPGLGWIEGKTVKFSFSDENRLKIPHMGWNDVKINKKSQLFDDMYEEPCFYFVHSYHLMCKNKDDVLTTTVYGYEFVSAIEHENIFATQYHPEKSHKYGLKLIKNFVEL
jgi:glutamine amidotransferase